MTPRHLLVAIFSLLATACSSEIYLRDGVTDGDSFYLSQRALVDDDPVLQSWVSYSLTRSACQLETVSDNPARANSFKCELIARRHMLETWQEKKQGNPLLADAYLDDLAAVADAGFIEEHVAQHFGRRSWWTPDDLDLRDYRRWQDRTLPDLEPETRLIGSWNYASKVSAK
jgi:hypothetical protein